MSWFQSLISCFRRTNSWNEWTEELSGQCVADVRSRLGQQVQRMSRHESRGYIRARAGLVVNKAVESVVQDQQIAAHKLPELRSRVLETTTRLVHQDVVNQTGRIPRRRAA